MTSPAPSGSVPLVEVVRSGFVEGRHHGSLVFLDPEGGVSRSFGVPEAAMLPRSCAKPLQAVAMVRAGLPLTGELLALACASHSGEPFHLDGVRRMLATVGLDETALQNVPDLPLDDTERAKAIRRGQTPTPIAMNCSGKHAAMLVTCVVNGWPTETYREPDHPLQLTIRSTVEDLTGVPVQTVAVDGCGAPLLSTTLVGLATAFRRIAVGVDGPESLVGQAIRDFPEWVSGTHRDEAALLHAVPDAIAKAGAESCYAVALADGRAIALKIDDGSPRARPVLMAAALQSLGVPEEPGVDPDALAATGVMTLYGGGQPVGSLRAVL